MATETSKAKQAVSKRHVQCRLVFMLSSLPKTLRGGIIDKISETSSYVIPVNDRETKFQPPAHAAACSRKIQRTQVPSAPGLQLGFEFGDAPFQGSHCGFHFLRGVARRDVFGAIPIEGNDVDKEQAFDDSADLGLGELSNEFGMAAGVLDPAMAEDLQPGAPGVIHEEKGHPVVPAEVAG